MDVDAAAVGNLSREELKGTGNHVHARYFCILAARGTPAFLWGSVAPWDAANLFYYDETLVEHVRTSAGEQRVTTLEELAQVLEFSLTSDSDIRVWVHEGMETTVKELMDLI